MENNQLFANTVSNINASILIGLAFLYMLRRFLTSNQYKFNIFKGKVRLIGTWMALISALSMLVFLVLAVFLSLSSPLSRSSIELVKFMNNDSILNFHGFIINLSSFMINALCIAEVLLVSAIFIAVSSAKSPTANTKEQLLIEKPISVFSKIWAFLRIGIWSYLYFNMRKIKEELAVFTEETINVAEYTLASILLLLITVNGQKKTTNKDNQNLLLICLVLYGMARHAVSLINFPFAIQEIHLEILMSLRLGLLISIYITLINHLCFKAKTKSKEEITYRPVNAESDQCEIALIAPLVEFDESTGLIKK